MISGLMNLSCQIVRRGPSGMEDDYGNEIAGESVVSTVCEFQKQNTMGEQESGSRNDLADSSWDVFFPADTDIDSGDALLVDGKEYEVDGEPWTVRNPVTGQLSHVECSVKRVAGSEAGS